MKYSICIEPLFEDIKVEERVRFISQFGFKTIEFWDPGEKNLDMLKKNCEKYKVNISDCTLNDPWGINRLNVETKNFIANFKKTIPMIKKINCNKVICLTGEIEKDKSRKDQRKRIVENLQEAGKIADREDIYIVLEALNSYVDHKDYFLDSSKLGFDIIKEVNHERIKLLYDIYHMQIMEGNIISNIKKNIDFIGHFHAAGVPGRHELFTGEINYTNVIEEIENLGYEGYFGLEYWPSIDPEKSLSKTAQFLKISS
jgi:hydroxypyruvate isomerase